MSPGSWSFFLMPANLLRHWTPAVAYDPSRGGTEHDQIQRVAWCDTENNHIDVMFSKKTQ